MIMTIARFNCDRTVKFKCVRMSFYMSNYCTVCACTYMYVRRMGRVIDNVTHVYMIGQ